MSRLDIKSPSKAETVVENLYRDMERRIAASPPGLCPVDMSLNFLRLSHAQTCGKCVPCRIGLGQLSLLIEQVLDGRGTMDTIAIIEKTARSIVNTPSPVWPCVPPGWIFPAIWLWWAKAAAPTPCA